MLTIQFKNKKELYQSYMPFLKGGGLFIPTSSIESFPLGMAVEVACLFPEEKTELTIQGQVAWTTPDSAKGQWETGIGIAFGESNANEKINEKIQDLLSKELLTEQATYTL